MEFPLTFGLQKIGLPLIPVTINKTIVCLLIDTGATQNILFTYVYEHFKNIFKILDETTKVMGIEGHYKTANVIKATFSFNNTKYTTDFAVLDASKAAMQIQEETGVQIHGILGTHFLIKNQWILDFKTYNIIND